VSIGGVRRYRSRRLAGILVAVTLAAATSACAIPTEDQPQQINRDLPTTTVTEVP
jgi:hypothetical protein